jgi:RNA polymerase sigma factor (sigma-70 family)
MVFGTCRRLLGNITDADDAFQATFVVLVRKAHTLTERPCVGNYLYGVAFRTAQRLKAMALKRRLKEAQAESSKSFPDQSELLTALDAELARLPDKYREPVVLCELEGLSRREVAQSLGIPEGTNSSRLATAHRML